MRKSQLKQLLDDPANVMFDYYVSFSSTELIIFIPAANNENGHVSI